MQGAAEQGQGGGKWNPRLLGLPENRVRVRAAFLGGGFGAKVYVKMEALAVALSLLARRPVKVALTMQEQFFTISKHGSTFRIKSAVTKNGRDHRALLRGYL
jgi:CO/xanthine dehydrogenase Mo-binding subunit